MLFNTLIKKQRFQIKYHFKKRFHIRKKQNYYSFKKRKPFSIKHRFIIRNFKVKHAFLKPYFKQNGKLRKRYHPFFKRQFKRKHSKFLKKNLNFKKKPIITRNHFKRKRHYKIRLHYKIRKHIKQVRRRIMNNTVQRKYIIQQKGLREIKYYYFLKNTEYPYHSHVNKVIRKKTLQNKKKHIRFRKFLYFQKSTYKLLKKKKRKPRPWTKKFHLYLKKKQLSSKRKRRLTILVSNLKKYFARKNSTSFLNIYYKKPTERRFFYNALVIKK